MKFSCWKILFCTTFRVCWVRGQKQPETETNNIEINILVSINCNVYKGVCKRVWSYTEFTVTPQKSVVEILMSVEYY